MKELWLEVSKDKYEFPIHIAESLGELAEMCGVTKNTISHNMSLSKAQGKQCKYVKCKLVEEEGE